MAFKKLERSSRAPSGWRLATVEEAKNRLESIKLSNLLEKWDRARLLDGWIGGSGYDFHVQVGFRSCLGYMLLVESPTGEISDSVNETYAGLYSNVRVNEEGRGAALFLCCEDWNYEVVHWVIKSEKKEDNAIGVRINLGDEMEERSKLVSAVARELQRVREKSRVPRTEFSCASMRALMSDMQDSVRDKVRDSRTFSRIEVYDLGDQCWNEMGLTEDLMRFRGFGFDTNVDLTWEEVADTVWYVAADAMAVVIVRECCKSRQQKNVHPSERKSMEEQEFVASVVAYANEVLEGNFFGDDSLWKIVKKWAEMAKGDCKSFNKLLRDQGYGTFSYDGKYGVLNTFLVQAAKKEDVNLVKRLIECGVQPSETDDKRKKTALHHAAKLNDVNGAKMLLTKSPELLVNAVDNKERTPLHRAARCGHVVMCRLLLHHNASVTSKDKSGQIPLHHALSREHQNEEVIRVLISANAQNNVEVNCEGQASGHLVDAEDAKGMTPLHFAVECQGTNPRMVTSLLSLSNHPEAYFKKLDLSLYLRESSRMGYMVLVEKLLITGANPLDRDDEGKTTLHYAAEGKSELTAFEIIIKLLGNKNGRVQNVELATACDKYGRSVLHVAAFLGHKDLCLWLLNQETCINVDTVDRDGQSALYYAVAGAHDDDEVLDALIFRGQGVIQVHVKDLSQTTPLHMAAERGNPKMVGKLLSKRLISKQDERNKYVRAADVLGQTALHKAAKGGHRRIVRILLEEGAHPLEERDCDGKTALHHAVQAENDEDAMAIAKLLLNKCESDKQKSLLLFASAVGIGSAEQSMRSNSPLKKYLEQEKCKILKTSETENLLRVAATSGNIDMTREFLTRGANIAVIRSDKWRTYLPTEENKNVESVLKKIDNIVEQGTDKPALLDNLGRSSFANGLAALFLNPFVKSPITVGISGEWGMGKSSLMVQTESILIKTAAQISFSNSLQIEDFPGASKSKLSATGKDRRKKIAQSIKMLSTTKESNNCNSRLERSNAKKWDPNCHSEIKPKLNVIQKFGMFIKGLFRTKKNFKNHRAKVRDPLSEFLSNYQPKYHGVFKSLAVMDRSDMFEYEEDEEESGSGNRSHGMGSGMPWEEDSMQGTTPSILTVRYNAWQYRNESEAWAGLAVEITKELEATMTVAQKLRTSWRYNWKTRKNNICFGVILPCFLAVLMAIWFTIIVWLLLERTVSEDIKDLKYGSLPATGIAAVWAVVKSVMTFVKPISSHIVDYICLPDHSGKLGYHQKVIFDINFLKEELGEKPSWWWKVFAYIWCWITFSWDENYAPKTMIPKMPPASKNNLRIVVFVDDLDRCQENVILQILSAVNLVLAACEINVILGMDKSMIERAIIRMFGDKSNKPNQSSQDLADKYLRKIIQLPLDLPDPSSSESESFLQAQLGMVDAATMDSEEQAEIHNAYAHRKVNPKFQMGISDPKKSKPATATGETMKYLAENGATEERDRGFSDTPREGSVKKLRTETGLVAEETTILMPDTTEDDQLSKREEQDPGNNDKMTGAKKSRWYEQRENSENEQRLMELSPITSEMLFPKYSEGERNAFCFLQTKATRSRRLPREWKRLLYYHRLAWNILSKSPEVKPLAGWQVQLIAWVFVCWQWKRLITTLVMNWHDLRVLKNWITVKDIQQQENSGPSLREIVEHYIDERWPADEMSDIFQGVGVNKNKKVLEPSMRTISKEGDTNGEEYLKEVVRKVLKEEMKQKRRYSLKLKGLQGKRSKKGQRREKEQDLEDGLKLVITKALQEGKEVEDLLEVIVRKVLKEGKVGDVSSSSEEGNKGKSSVDQGAGIKQKQKASQKESNKRKIKLNMDEEEEREDWRKLKETLSRYNVSMDGIQAFQKFRFYCMPGHLPWPLLKH